MLGRRLTAVRVLAGLDGSYHFQICPTSSVAPSLREEAGILLPGFEAAGR